MYNPNWGRYIESVKSAQMQYLYIDIVDTVIHRGVNCGCNKHK